MPVLYMLVVHPVRCCSCRYINPDFDDGCLNVKIKMVSTSLLLIVKHITVSLTDWLDWRVVQGDGPRWRHTVRHTAAVECGEFDTKHVQLGRSAAELHGSVHRITHG